MARRVHVYGLDIETDTTVDGLDPEVAPIVTVAVSLDGYEEVFSGDERGLLFDLDQRMAELEPGVIAHVERRGVRPAVPRRSSDRPRPAARAAARARSPHRDDAGRRCGAIAGAYRAGVVRPRARRRVPALPRRCRPGDAGVLLAQVDRPARRSSRRSRSTASASTTSSARRSTPTRRATPASHACSPNAAGAPPAASSTASPTSTTLASTASRSRAQLEAIAVGPEDSRQYRSVGDRYRLESAGEHADLPIATTRGSSPRRRS